MPSRSRRPHRHRRRVYVEPDTPRHVPRQLLRQQRDQLALRHRPVHADVLTVVGVIILVPGIVQAITDSGETLAQLGSVLALLSMALFVYLVIRHGVGAAAPSAAPHEAESAA